MVPSVKAGKEVWAPGSLIFLQWPGLMYPQKRVCVAVGVKDPPRKCTFGVFRRVNAGEDTQRIADKEDMFIRLDLVVFIFLTHIYMPIHLPIHMPIHIFF